MAQKCEARNAHRRLGAYSVTASGKVVQSFRAVGLSDRQIHIDRAELLLNGKSFSFTNGDERRKVKHDHGKTVESICYNI